MDRQFLQYAHPANVVFVSQFYSGDSVKKGQFENDLQTAIDNAQIGATIISYGNRENYSARDGITVLFFNEIQYALNPEDFLGQIIYSNGSAFMGLDYPLIWEGYIYQESTNLPTLVSTRRNDFGVELHASSPFGRLDAGIYSIRFASAVANSVEQMRSEGSISINSFPSLPIGVVVGQNSGESTSIFRFATAVSDLSVYEDGLTGDQIFLRLMVYP